MLNRLSNRVETALAGWALILGTLTLAATLSAAPQAADANPANANAAQEKALVDKYCVACHSTRLKSGGLVLQNIDFTHPAEHAEIFEKVALKIHGGMMPPPGLPRPDKAVLNQFAASLENQLDQAYFANFKAGKGNPGFVGIHRLNRAEYGNAVRDLLGLEWMSPTCFRPTIPTSASTTSPTR